MEGKDQVSEAEAYKTIQEALNEANFKEAQQIAHSLLERNPEDQDAAQVMLYCQLNLDEFKDALAKTSKTKKNRPFQHAYVLHKLGKNSEAKAFISSLEANIKASPGIRHLEAQIAYKLDRFKESSEAYTHIMEDEKTLEGGNDQITEALKDNYSSILLLEKDYERIVKLMAGGSSEVLESVRGWQNLSAAYAELGQFQRSVQALLEAIAKQRERQEKNQFQEKILEKEGNDLQIEWLYLLEKMARERNLKSQESGKLEQNYFSKFVGRFKQLLRLRTIEFNNELMLVNNYVGLKREKLASIAHRLEKILTRKDKIPLFMRVHIQVNAVLTLLHREKHKEGLQLLKEVEQAHPEATSIDPRILLLNLHSLVKSKKYEEAKVYLQNHLASKSHDDLFSNLLLAQIALLTHKSWNEPIELLMTQIESSALLSNLAFVMFLFRILLKLEKRAAVGNLMLKVAQVKELPLETYKYVVEEGLVNGFHQEVIVIYETHSKRLKTEGAEGAYYEALMHVDPDRCVSLQEEVDHSGIHDLEKLSALFEKYFGTGKRGAEKKQIKEVPGVEDKIEEGKKEGQAKKKKKKPHYPKGFDPENPGAMPDPERWLPKWQRSKYRKKHGGANLLRGPQGGFQDAKTKSGAVEDVAVTKTRYGKKRN